MTPARTMQRCPLGDIGVIAWVVLVPMAGARCGRVSRPGFRSDSGW
jgi:hypothetical protein